MRGRSRRSAFRATWRRTSREPAQLRLRIVDSRRIDPATIMPSYYRTDDLVRVGAAWRGRPILTAEQVEDVVAFLATLRD